MLRWTKVSLDNSLLGQLWHWTKVPWTTVSLEDCLLDNYCNTHHFSWRHLSYQEYLGCYRLNFDQSFWIWTYFFAGLDLFWSRPKFLSPTNLFGPNCYLDPKCFWTQSFYLNFLDTTSFIWNFFRLKIFGLREGFKKMWNLGFWLNLRWPLPPPPNLGPVIR